MTPNSFLRFKILSPFSILSSLVVLISATNPMMDTCKPKSCGNISNISYPFWLKQQHPSYCGYPAFAVSCENNRPVLNLSQNFHILDISYENQSVVLVDAWFHNNSCPHHDYNINFRLSMFEISSVNRVLVFSNCSNVPVNSFKVPCELLKNSSVYLSEDHWTDKQEISLPPMPYCHSERRPVLGYQGANNSDYATLLTSGFLLKWEVGNCTECKQSNGQCGYDNITAGFMCICNDQTHPRHWRCKEFQKEKRTKLIITGVSVAGFATFLVACCLFLSYKLCKRNQKSSTILLGRTYSSESFSMREDTECQTSIFSYRELREATDNFSESKELGDGGFGTVYKGQLRDGRIVAVKRLYENNYKRVEQFMNEVAILSRLRHQNLVTLYGCTSRHSRELLLVYEYIPNGTVADHLHGHRAHEASLSWQVRLSIAVETANALAYLHAVKPPIIHRDVKTNNILLDNNFNVKVADFGLSRLFPLDATHISTAPQGTPGYLDPEYHQCYRLTHKSDVYSFGVVLVELISSKPAVDVTRRHHEINLASMAINKIQNNELDELVDAKLFSESEEVRRMIKVVAELAFRCLQGERDLRPPIKEVLEVLRGVQSSEGGVMEDGFAAMEEGCSVSSAPPVSPDSVMDHGCVSESTTSLTSL